MRGRIATVVILVLGACTAQPRRAFSDTFAGQPFIITFWCGPPLQDFTDARAEEIAAAGFTVVGPPCEGGLDPASNRRALDVAAGHGLRVWINDPRLGGNLGAADPEPVVRAVVDAYRDHPALAAYFVVDEPVVGQFSSVGAMAEQIHARDPQRFAYINLLPDYISPDHLGAASYEEYVERFILTTQPRLLSFDYYPFRTDEDRPTFFRNLAIIRAAAEHHGLPFMLIVLAMPHGPYRDPTEAEIAWQVFHALAFGARGISYFAYWTPHDREAERQQFRTGLLDRGEPTRHYFEVQRINREVRAITSQLATFRSLGVSDSAKRIAPGPGLPDGPIDSVSGGTVTGGWFGDGEGRLAVLLVNRDYRAAATLRVRLRPGTPAPEIFDVDTQAWQLGLPQPLTIGPGRARLLRWNAGGPADRAPLLSSSCPIENGHGPSDRLGVRWVRRGG